MIGFVEVILGRHIPHSILLSVQPYENKSKNHDLLRYADINYTGKNAENIFEQLKKTLVY